MFVGGFSLSLMWQQAASGHNDVLGIWDSVLIL